MKTDLRTKTEFVACICIDDYTARGLVDPDCPYHSYGGDDAEEEIRRLRTRHAEAVAALRAVVPILERLDTLRHLDKNFTPLDDCRALLARHDAEKGEERAT